MTLGDILVLLVITVIAAQFWRIRAVSEAARIFLKQFCEQRDLQLIAIARRKTRLILYKGKLDWQCEYDFEFSGNGEDKYTGQAVFKGLEAVDTSLPAYRIP